MEYSFYVFPLNKEMIDCVIKDALVKMFTFIPLFQI